MLKATAVCFNSNQADYWSELEKMAILHRKKGSPPASSQPKPVSLHDQLVLRAERWLISQGCGFAIRAPFKSWVSEQPDAIGWRESVSLLVEVKVSRSDFLADNKKATRAEPGTGMGNWRFYFCPPQLILIDEVPEGWGLIWASPNKVIQTFGVPSNTNWFKFPFVANESAEKIFLASALRRYAKNGRLAEIYAVN